MFRRASSAESSTRVPYHPPSSPPSTKVVGAWLGNNNNHNNNLSTYICPLCFRAFTSTQALGGHQNAHRKERNEERAHYIRYRLENNRNLLSASASNDNLVDMAASLPPPPPSECYYLGPETHSTNFEAGPSHKRTKKSNQEEREGETLSLKLTLAVGESARASSENATMAYTYPDVLFPASEFLETTLDLTLRL